MSPGRHGDADSHSAGEELPACRADDVSVMVSWERDGGGLRGQVIAENTGSRACRLPGKPGVIPLGLDGRPLPARTMVTLEMVLPGYVVLEPGQRAAAPVTWGGWDGAIASPQAQVTWEGGAAAAAVQGPTQPASTGRPVISPRPGFACSGKTAGRPGPPRPGTSTPAAHPATHTHPSES